VSSSYDKAMLQFGGGEKVSTERCLLSHKCRMMLGTRIRIVCALFTAANGDPYISMTIFLKSLMLLLLPLLLLCPTAAHAVQHEGGKELHLGGRREVGNSSSSAASAAETKNVCSQLYEPV
jgi:hypothetical protein